MSFCLYQKTGYLVCDLLFIVQFVKDDECRPTAILLLDMTDNDADKEFDVYDQSSLDMTHNDADKEFDVYDQSFEKVK